MFFINGPCAILYVTGLVLVCSLLTVLVLYSLCSRSLVRPYESTTTTQSSSVFLSFFPALYNPPPPPPTNPSCQVVSETGTSCPICSCLPPPPPLTFFLCKRNWIFLLHFRRIDEQLERSKKTVEKLRLLYKREEFFFHHLQFCQNWRTIRVRSCEKKFSLSPSLFSR